MYSLNMKFLGCYNFFFTMNYKSRFVLSNVFFISLERGGGQERIYSAYSPNVSISEIFFPR